MHGHGHVSVLIDYSGGFIHGLIMAIMNLAVICFIFLFLSTSVHLHVILQVHTHTDTQTHTHTHTHTHTYTQRHTPKATSTYTPTAGLYSQESRLYGFRAMSSEP